MPKITYCNSAMSEEPSLKNQIHFLDEASLNEAKLEIADNVETAWFNATQNASIVSAYEVACAAFEGIDIVVNCAGISISSLITQTSENDYDTLMDILAKGQFLFLKKV